VLEPDRSIFELRGDIPTNASLPYAGIPPIIQTSSANRYTSPIHLSLVHCCANAHPRRERLLFDLYVLKIADNSFAGDALEL
jgi:hypothetical protein